MRTIPKRKTKLPKHPLPSRRRPLPLPLSSPLLLCTSLISFKSEEGAALYPVYISIFDRDLILRSNLEAVRSRSVHWFCSVFNFSLFLLLYLVLRWQHGWTSFDLRRPRYLSSCRNMDAPITRIWWQRTNSTWWILQLLRSARNYPSSYFTPALRGNSIPCIDRFSFLLGF